MNYQPKGGMCESCDRSAEDCGGHDFKSIPRIPKPDGATHWALLPDGGVIFYKINEQILLWAPYSKAWISPGIVPYTIHPFDA